MATVAYCTDFPAELSRISLQLSTYIGEMADGNEIVADLEKEGVSAGVVAVKSGAGKAVGGVLDVAKDESRKVVIKLTITIPSNRGRVQGSSWILARLKISCLWKLRTRRKWSTRCIRKKWTFSGIAGVISYQWKDSGKNTVWH